MSKIYWDKLRESFKKDSGPIPDYATYYESTEWAARIYRCAKRLISAACFRESSNTAYVRTRNPLLSVIGYYYAMFHMSVGVLYVDYATPISQLSNLTHSKLKNLVESKLVRRSLIQRYFLDLFLDLQELREYSNYSFGEYHMDSRGNQVDLKNEIESMYARTGAAFNHALDFIRRASAESSKDDSLRLWISSMISDTLYDDLSYTYMSEDDEKKVTDYLLSVDFTH